MKKKAIKAERSRMEIIFELAKYAHYDWYQDILGWSTDKLKMLLEYYERPEEKKIGGKVVMLFEFDVRT